MDNDPYYCEDCGTPVFTSDPNVCQQCAEPLCVEHAVAGYCRECQGVRDADYPTPEQEAQRDAENLAAMLGYLRDSSPRSLADEARDEWLGDLKAGRWFDAGMPPWHTFEVEDDCYAD